MADNSSSTPPSGNTASTAPVQNQTATQTPAAAPKADAKQATPAEIRRMKLKLDGSEVELPESDVIALAQQGKAAQKRFQEAAQMRKQAEELINYAKTNPREFFNKTGMDVRKFSEETLMEILTQEQMTPEQRKAKENEDRLKQYEKAEKEAADRKRQDEMKALEEKHIKNYNELFIKALNESGLPKTAFTVKRMAELQLINVRNNYDLDASQLAKIVRQDYEAEIKALYDNSDGDQLMAILGEAAVKKLSKAQIAKLKSRGIKPAKQTNKDTAESAESGMSWRELQKRNRRM